MTEVLRLYAADGKPDIIMICTKDNAFDAEVQSDAKGEFIMLPDELLPKRKQRKVYLECRKREGQGK